MSKQRILYVEDEHAVARGLTYALTREGFDVTWAETGQDAPEVARSRAPHLILLDIRLPDISGYDVCRQVRAEGMRQPILVLTLSRVEAGLVRMDMADHDAAELVQAVIASSGPRRKRNGSRCRLRT
jgi:DNA-binding response OmpR family regulator